MADKLECSGIPSKLQAALKDFANRFNNATPDEISRALAAVASSSPATAALPAPVPKEEADHFRDSWAECVREKHEIAAQRDKALEAISLDAARLDALEAYVNEHGALLIHTGESDQLFSTRPSPSWRFSASLGVWPGRTLREALDDLR